MFKTYFMTQYPSHMTQYSIEVYHCIFQKSAISIQPIAFNPVDSLLQVQKHNISLMKFDLFYPKKFLLLNISCIIKLVKKL